MFMIKRVVNQRGDTIVEVLIAMLVVATVLGGAYASAGHSLNNSRQSQERGEALKLVEGQVEKLRQLANTVNSSIFASPRDIFCIDSSNTVQVATEPAITSLVQPVSSDNLNSYKAPCKNLGPGQFYNIAIERSSDPAYPNQFTVYSRWERAGGNGREELKIVVRVYQ